MNLHTAVMAAEAQRPSTVLKSRSELLLNAENRVIIARPKDIDAALRDLKIVLEKCGQSCDAAESIVTNWQALRHVIASLHGSVKPSGLVH